MALTISKNIVVPIETEYHSYSYWTTTNPIVGPNHGAVETDDFRLKIGDGKARYNDLDFSAYVAVDKAPDSGGLATETTAGSVAYIAPESEIKASTGDGVLKSKYTSIITQKATDAMMSIGVYDTVGQRSLQPWATPKPGYKVLTGQFIDPSDSAHAALDLYLTQNPHEVITMSEYEALLAANGGMGGVHYYAKSETGAIRVPDLRTTYENEDVYIPVVFTGLGSSYISESGMLVVQEARSKPVGEVFDVLIDDTVFPPAYPAGAIPFDGEWKYKASYPQLFELLVKTGQIIPATEWEALFASQNGTVEYFAYDVSGAEGPMFRAPIYNPASRNWPLNTVKCVQGINAVADPVGTNISAVLTAANYVVEMRAMYWTLLTRIKALETRVESLEGATVVESGGDETGWYRVYGDGWIEQGGRVAPTSPYNSFTITFIKPFAQPVCPTVNRVMNSTSTDNVSPAYVRSFTATNATVNAINSSTNYVSWLASGYGA